MGYRLGCVPYVNALPLVAMFESDPGLGVRVDYDLPSRLPSRLDSGAADAVLVSSHYLLTHPGLVAADDVAIGSDGPVESVRLFSRLPFQDIRTLALDEGSLTSNALALAWLRERIGVAPLTQTLPPDLDAMLGSADAAVLIGDAGMAASGDGLHVKDLGAAWTEWTGLPFVWAVWVGRSALTQDLASLLHEAAGRTGLGREAEPSSMAGRVIAQGAAQTGLSPERIRRYLTETMRYRIGPRGRAGLDRFGQALFDNRLAERVFSPYWVTGTLAPHGRGG